MNVIINQIKQVVNNYITKNIDTGDKIIDVAVSVIILALFDVITKYIYEKITEYIEKPKLGKNPWDFDPLEVKKIKEEDVKKLKYTLNLGYTSKLRINGDESYFTDNIHSWIDSTFGEKCSRQSAIRCVLKDESENIVPLDGLEITKKNVKNLIVNVNKIDKKFIFMPIWSYKDRDKIEYIYVYDNLLWSNSMEELNKLIKHISSYSAEKYDVVCSKKKEKIIQRDLEIVELTESWKDDKKDYSRAYKHVGYVNKNKTFDKIFFDEKGKLINMLERYRKRKIYPESLGLDNKLGILLYGPPGTGKTGTIFCVANYLQKPIMLINSLKVKKSTIISAVNELKRSHIIVLDEFDHLLQELKMEDNKHSGFFSNYNNNDDLHKEIKKIAKTKKLPKKESITKIDDQNDDEIVINFSDNDTDNEKTKRHISQYKDIPNDVFMYKLLDSFGDDDGRIIIATTNNPNMVNPVLLRPGRFDMKLCLGYCTFDMFVNISKNVFDLDNYISDKSNVKKIEDVLKLNITPLILINTLILSESIEDALDKLSKQKQKYYDKKPSEDIDN